MRIQQIIGRRFRHKGGGIDIAGGIDAVVAANVGESGSVSRASREQHVVSDGGRSGGPELGTPEGPAGQPASPPDRGKGTA